MTADITPFDLLPTNVIDQVRAAAHAATEADGAAPLSEAFLLGLPRAARHLVATAEGRVIGYAQTAADGSCEAFVAPQHRTKGVGTALVTAVLTANPRARIWAHGDLPGSRALASRLGLDIVRELLVLSRPVTDGDESDPVLPKGVTHRPFVPGRDEAALLAVNAAAFIDHAEQGDLDADGLAERMAQPWFEAEGLILLEDGDPDRLAGFHWTKVDPPEGDLGEVYVVGVHPDLHGHGLGGPLTRLGLAHLARRGMHEVELYVEGDNTPALATYRRSGFTRKAAHLMYARGDHDPVSD